MGTDRTIRKGVRCDRLLQYGQLHNTGVRCELYYPGVIQTPYKYSKIKQTSVRLTIALSYICNKISSPNDMRYLQLCSLLLALSACSTHSPDIDVACEIDLQNNYLLNGKPRRGSKEKFKFTDRPTPSISIQQRNLSQQQAFRQVTPLSRIVCKHIVITFFFGLTTDTTVS